MGLEIYEEKSRIRVVFGISFYHFEFLQNSEVNTDGRKNYKEE